MRREEFKMERTGLLEVGDVLPITEGKSIIIQNANFGMSKKLQKGTL